MDNNTNTYTFEKKKKLLDRINKLSSRTDFEQIKKIILNKNPELDSMKNQNGLFLQFNYLSNDSYVELASYLDKTDKLKLKKLKEEIMNTSEMMSDEDTFVNSDKNISKKLRLTNTESHIINRVKYEKELKKNESMSEIDEFHVYDPDLAHKKKSELKVESRVDIFVSIKEETEKRKNKKNVAPNEDTIIIPKKSHRYVKEKN